jgi:uncharacterized protein (TIGR03083 family)
MRSEPVLNAWETELDQLAEVMLEVAPQDWSRPSPCPPWTVAELFGHVATAVDRLPGMLAAPAPARAEVSAAGYCRPDDRFSAQTNSARLEVAGRRVAAASDGHALALAFDASRHDIVQLCRQEPAGRVVRTVLLRKLTGRLPLTEQEAAGLGGRRLTLG